MSDIVGEGRMVKKIELTREQLYEKVRSTPVSKPANELGMSDEDVTEPMPKEMQEPNHG